MVRRDNIFDSTESGLRMTSLEVGLPPLAALLVKEIGEGKYPVGSLLPPEQNLERMHGLSRYAVREATAKLQELGLNQKRRGIGTTVVAREPRERRVYRMSTAEDFASFAKSTSFLINSFETIEAQPGPDPMFRLRENGHRWLRITGLRHTLRTHEILSVDMACIREDYSDLPNLGRSLSTNISGLVESNFGIRFERIEQEIAADLASEMDANTLGIGVGAAILVMMRKFMLGGEALVLVMSRHAADKFRYTNSLELVLQTGR